MRCLIIGASAGLGRCLAEGLAAQGHDLYLVSSDERDLASLTNDLALRFGVSTGYATVDLRAFDAEALRSHAIDFFKEAPSALFYIAGVGNRNDSGRLEAQILDTLINVNFRSGIAIANAFIPDMIDKKTKLCVGVGSVAAVRGRSNNMLYGAAKRGLEFYFEALRHRLYASGCRVQFYRLGFMRTSMLEGRKTLLPAVEPAEIAHLIIRNLNRDVGIVYAPSWWRPIAIILKFLPWCIFRKMAV